MLERKPTGVESLIIRSLFMLFVDTDADAEAIAEDAGCDVEEVRDLMRQAI